MTFVPTSSAPPSLALTMVAAALLAAASGCDRNAKPARAPNSARNVLNVPYPIADAERIEGAGRAALAKATFFFVDVAEAAPDRRLVEPRRLDDELPTLVAHHLDGSSRAFWELRRLPFDGPGSVLPIEKTPQELADVDVHVPAQTVWLVGPKGSCRARVGSPVAQLDPGGRELVTVGYRLEDCSGAEWAPIGIAADALPVDFRWVAAQTLVDRALDQEKGWDDPLAAHIEWPQWDEPEPPALQWARVREIPEVSPRVVQLQIAALDAAMLDDPRPFCERQVQWSLADGWYNDRWLDPVPWHADAIAPYMLGAFVNGDQVDAVIYDDSLDGLVVVPPGPLDDMDDPSAWTQVFVPTGIHAPGTLDAWAQQPIDDGLPPGPACTLASATSP